MAFYFTLSCLRSCVLLGCNCMYVYLATNSYGEDNYEIMKKFIGIREIMKDYTRFLMKEAHETGSPVIRAMFYEFPNDEITWNLKTQYMFGPDILVAPIIESGSKKRTVYLPEGSKWIDARNNQAYDGGQFVEASANIDTLPIFLRDGKQDYLIGKI